MAEDVNVVLIQTVKNKQETTFETGVKELEDIINDLNAKYDEDGNAEYDYQVNAIIEDGAATSVVIYDKTNNYEKPEEAQPTEDVIIRLEGYTIYVDRTGEATVHDEVAAIEKLLGDEGYTNVTITLDEDTNEIKSVKADYNKVTFNFKVNPDASETAVAADSDALTAAIEDGATTIYLGSNTYTVDEKLTKDLTIVGNGNTVIKFDEDTNDTGYASVVMTQKNLTISGVVFNNIGDEKGAWWGVLFEDDNAGEVKIEDCVFNVTGNEKNTSMAIYLGQGVTGGYIKNCVFNMGEGSAAAIGIDGLAGEFTITNCTFNGQGLRGYDVEWFVEDDEAGELTCDASIDLEIIDQDA